MQISYRAHCNGISRVCLTLLLSTGLYSGICLPAYGQVVELGDNAPVLNTFDSNGVDLQSGKLSISLISLGIGDQSARGALSYSFDTSDSGSNLTAGSVQPDTVDGTLYNVRVLGVPDRFKLTGSLATGSFANNSGNQSTLTYNSTTSVYTYTSSNGVIAHLTVKVGTAAPDNPYALITDAKYPSGETITWHYALAPDIAHYDWISVSSNLGYQVRAVRTQTAGWGWAITSVVAFNMANENCDPGAAACTLVGSWPKYTISYSTSQWTATDNIGRVTSSVSSLLTTSGTSTFTSPQGRQTVYTYIQQTSLGPPDYYQVTSITKAGRVWNYTTSDVYHPNIYQPNAGNVSIDSLPFRGVNWEGSSGRLLYSTDGGTAYSAIIHTGYGFDSAGRLTSESVSNVQGFSLGFTYDANGNLKTQSRGSINTGDPALVVTKDYPSTCANLITCHEPTDIIDANNHRYDYSYDPTHGGVTSVLAPATPSGVRPSTQYSYAQYSAQYHDGTGALVTGAPVYKLVSKSTCQTLASCAGTADEVRTVYDYDTQNALLLKSVTVQTGTGTILSTISRTYYPTGDLKTEDGPLSGTDDTTRYYYDGARQLVGIIGPDPDGAGPLLRPATRITYDLDGLTTLKETGTATDQSDSGMSTFTPALATAYTYDARGDLSAVQQIAGGAVYAVTQTTTNYTTTGWYTCVATRMNPAVFGSLPTSACTLGTAGSVGADRITKTVYDALGRVVSVTTALGTADESIDQSYVYTALSKVELTDALNNKTTYTTDGYLRPYETQYPLPTQGSNTSSTTDYELAARDAVGNVTSRRLRNGQTIGYSYDALNRLSMKDIPGGTSGDVYFGYDLLGRLSYARFGSASGQGVSNNYDALSRLTDTTTTMGGISRTLSYQYDLAGNRTRITHPDGVYFAYGYDVLGRMNHADWYSVATGVTPFFGIAYDNLGNRTSTTRGSSSTSYGYDSASRLTTLTQNFASGSLGGNTTFGYSPSGQITATTRSNDAYAYTGSADRNDASTINGLNQTTSVGAGTLTYDASGNLASNGGTTFGYDVEKRLVSATGTLNATLSYDPLGRLWQTSGGTLGTSQFLYDGDQMVAEYDGVTNALRRRFAFGPGTDEVILWDEGSAMNCSGTKLLHNDERGSIVAVADCSGNPVQANGYDEYGVPAAANWSSSFQQRFQYTGQMYLPELGLYYYKARIYSARLGRFLQTDPIGYSDGVNFYNYVGGDPVNGRDPSGLGWQPPAPPAPTPPPEPPADDPGPDIVVSTSRILNDAYGIGSIPNGGALALAAAMPPLSPAAHAAPPVRQGRLGKGPGRDGCPPGQAKLHGKCTEASAPPDDSGRWISTREGYIDGCVIGNNQVEFGNDLMAGGLVGSGVLFFLKRNPAIFVGVGLVGGLAYGAGRVNQLRYCP